MPIRNHQSTIGARRHWKAVGSRPRYLRLPPGIANTAYQDIVGKGDHAYSIRTGSGQIHFYFCDGAAYHQTNSPTYNVNIGHNSEQTTRFFNG